MITQSAYEEFDKQVATLIKKGYPKASGKTEKEFLKIIEPLREKLNLRDVFSIDIENGTISFVIVIKNELVSTETMMSLVKKNERQGITKLFPHESKDFQIIVEEQVPSSTAYLLVDIDRGKKSINIAPGEALRLIRSADRHPLSIDEGISIITHYPEFLIKNNCFSLLASRHSGDKRVPAIWINSDKNLNLGWCWDGNPHTWLGSASCKYRV